MTPRLSPVLTADDLPIEELQAARLDGEVFSFGEGFAPIDTIDNATHRAMAIASIAGPRLIAEQWSAAWILGASHTPPAVHQFCVSLAARARASAGPRIELREVRISASELLSAGPMLVTNHLRTATDILRLERRWDDDVREGLCRILAEGACSLEDCAAALQERGALSGRTQARSRLRELAREGLVTT